MNILRKIFVAALFGAAFVLQTVSAPANAADVARRSPVSSYVLGDSIAYGLHLAGIEGKLEEKLGGPSRISYDGGRSITTPGNQIGMTALESIEADWAFISTAGVFIIVLGLNPQEESFVTRQSQLVHRLRDIAPHAKYYWIDIGATASTHIEIWNSRNKIIYENAKPLGYSVISRYKAIFGQNANPMDIVPGKNFPGWADEPGLGGSGNIHGYYPELTQAILTSIEAPGNDVPTQVNSTASGARKLSTYVIGDSIAYGLHLDGLEEKLKKSLGGDSHINYDGGRSITTGGNQIQKSALESVDIDQDLIASADRIIVILGMNPGESSFDESQRLLVEKLRKYSPKASIYWVDIGATASSHIEIWNSRNKIIYENSTKLDYSVISRYKSIFGPSADPLSITPGLNFPGWKSEPGLDGPGNIHGYYPELSRAIVEALKGSAAENAKTKKVRAPCVREPQLYTYVLGDSIAFGLHKDRFALKIQSEFGGTTKISYDTGRSITTPGIQIKKSALDSVDLDKEYISKANLIIILLGTNQNEDSFANSQTQLMSKLLTLSPRAKYYWVDIGATIATQTPGWNARNKVIYEQASVLGYSVVSRYKAIFGADADPLNITPGLNFPDTETEPGYGAPGNIHGAYPALTEVLLDTISQYLGCTKTE